MTALKLWDRAAPVRPIKRRTNVAEGRSLREDVAGPVRAAARIRQSTLELNGQERDQHDPIVVNIGLNAGAASVGITRLRAKSGERWVYAATGPVTNIAARLCALATGGQILVSRTMAETIGGACQLREIGPRTLKNVGKPVEVFEIVTAEVKPDSMTRRRQRNG